MHLNVSITMSKEEALEGNGKPKFNVDELPSAFLQVIDGNSEVDSVHVNISVTEQVSMMPEAVPPPENGSPPPETPMPVIPTLKSTIQSKENE